MGWLIVAALLMAMVPALIAGVVRQRTTYMNWIGGWVSRSGRGRDSS